MRKKVGSSEAGKVLERLIELMRKLRSDDGCPWDREQDSESLARYIIEEAYELVDAIGEKDSDKICEELGDLLFQIIFQAQIFSEKKEFDFTDVMKRIDKKMRARHPHVFGKAKLKNAQEVKANWAKLKKRSRPEESALGSLPKSLPALMRAMRLTENASQVGFDWDRTEDVFLKVKEELEELECAIKKGRKSELQNELGDVFFALVNLSRFLGIDAEMALHRSCKKFEDRFHYIESRARESKKRLGNMSLKQMDILWEEAKGKE